MCALNKYEKKLSDYNAGVQEYQKYMDAYNAEKKELAKERKLKDEAAERKTLAKLKKKYPDV